MLVMFLANEPETLAPPGPELLSLGTLPPKGRDVKFSSISWLGAWTVA